MHDHSRHHLTLIHVYANVHSACKALSKQDCYMKEWQRLLQTLSSIQPGTACDVDGDRAAGRLAALLGFLDSCACKPAKLVLSCAAASPPSRSCKYSHCDSVMMMMQLQKDHVGTRTAMCLICHWSMLVQCRFNILILRFSEAS